MNRTYKTKALSIWENEGGAIIEARTRRPVDESTAISRNRRGTSVESHEGAGARCGPFSQLGNELFHGQPHVVDNAAERAGLEVF
jgi:hypothetical protein